MVAQQIMDVVFRTDASHQIGTGHLMRWRTPARALRKQGGFDHILAVLDTIYWQSRRAKKVGVLYRCYAGWCVMWDTKG